MADRDPVATLDKLAVALPKRVGDVLWDTLTAARDHLKAEAPLKTRTRGFPYVRRPQQLQGAILQVGLFAPAKWAAVFIGTGSTTISPKKSGGMLAIPTDNVKQFRGAPVSPSQYGGTVIFAGIIWGKAGWGALGGGVRQRRAAGEKLGRQTLIPLYILKGSVVIQKRIDPAALLAYAKPIFLAKLQAAFLLDQI